MTQQVSIENNSPKVIFMGTPEFAVASLDALLASGYQYYCSDHRTRQTSGPRHEDE